ncbi:hypothetical protein C0W96_08530 [Photobacterium kishitanii]|uniref:GH-E family nuclease n=1 Tax=Photobacterium kishitanii TaxID=318456 RepID=UPI0006960DDA|nr:GH-E family nuclease [Photobacterium kishitanii]PSV06498.1 hypothetical protein C0W96_08530 [Photobacterium kishitanii]PSV77381.1 hypothetical protein C0W29_02530 [Photobacterium kishitanii]
MGQPTEVSAKASVKFAKIDNNVLDPEPDSELDSKTETPREKIQRQRRERHEQSDKTWAYVQDNDARYAAHRAKILAMREVTQANEPINKVFCKSSMLPFGKVSVGKNREKASSVGNIGIYAAGSMDAVAVGGLSTAALSHIAGVGLADIDGLSTAALSRIAGVGLVDIAGFAMQVVGPIGILLALSPTRMGDGTLYGDEDIQLLKGVETLIRFGFDSEGIIHGYHVDKTEIPKRSVNLVGNKFVVDLEPGLSIEWVPVSEEIAGTKILVNPIPNVDSHTIYIHPEHEQGKEFDNTYITPISETDPNDYILIFPPTTGLPPMYVVFQLHGPDGRFISSGEPKPLLDRPSLRAETKRQIQNTARKDVNGNFIDDKGNIISNRHYGHKPGFEHRRLVRAAEELGMSQAEFNDYVNANPDHFQIEDAKTNLSHKNEKPGSGDLDEIIEHMEEFLEKRL